MIVNLYFINKRVIFITINLLILSINLICWQKSKNQLTNTKLHDVDLNQNLHEPFIVVQNSYEPFEKLFSKNNSILKLHHNTYVLSEQTKIINDFQASQTRYKTNDGYTVPALKRNIAVDCALILEGDEVEISKGEKWMDKYPKVPISEESYLEDTSNCSKFKYFRGYVDRPLSDEEASFPLAFSISSFRDLEQTERLLRSIYHPQNLYCIHVDSKSSLMFYRALKSIADCFHNVWISSKSSKVKWGDISVIMSEINCLRDLLKYFKGKYKYFINLTGQEFPLRSNLELVKIAKLFNGSNDITGSHLRMEMDRVTFKWGHIWSHKYQQTVLYNTHKPKEPYPYANITVFKGEAHGLFSARMTEYIIESFHGRMFFKWCRDTGHASEHFWNTLNYNSHLLAPGAYIGDLTLADHYSLHPVVRLKNWVNLYRDQWPCEGKVVRGLCVFSLRDLPWLFSRPELFANKFHLTYQPLAYDCLEELQRNRTRFKSYFNLSYYRNVPTVLYSRKDGL